MNQAQMGLWHGHNLSFAESYSSIFCHNAVTALTAIASAGSDTAYSAAPSPEARLVMKISLRLVTPPLLLAAGLTACSWNASAPPQPEPHRSAFVTPDKQRDVDRAPPLPRPRPPEAKIAKLPPPKLVGLSEAETVDLLGRPAEETAQPPGKVWLYRSGGCELSVHLFPDMDHGGFYALDYTASPDGEPRETCLRKIAAAIKHSQQTGESR